MLLHHFLDSNKSPNWVVGPLGIKSRELWHLLFDFQVLKLLSEFRLIVLLDIVLLPTDLREVAKFLILLTKLMHALVRP